MEVVQYISYKYDYLFFYIHIYIFYTGSFLYGYVYLSNQQYTDTVRRIILWMNFGTVF